MEKLNFAIIGAVDNQNTIDLKNEIESHGHYCEAMKITDLVYFSDGKGNYKITKDGKDLELFDIVFFRAYSKNIFEAKILAELMKFKKKTVIEDIATRGFLAGKMYEGSKLSRKNLPWLETYQALSKQNWKIVLEKMRYPIIVKPVNGSRGRDVMKFDNFKEAYGFLSETPKSFLAQEYVEIDGDVRVFVVDGQALGAMKRIVIDGDVRSNISLGAGSEIIELTNEMKKLAIDAAAAMGIAIAGVDLIQHGGNWRILEVNDSPQWQGFKETTGINPSKSIVEYAIEKHLKK